MNTTACAKCKTPITGCDNHFHDEWEIILQLEGDATAKIGNKDFKISPGTVMVIPPKVIHRNYSTVPFTDMFLQAKYLDFNDVVIINDAENNILTVMNMLHKTMTENENSSSAIADKLTELICLYINRLCNTDRRFPFVNKFKSIMHQNLSNPYFEIDSEIKKLGYHPDYFRRCFKTVTGITPLAYITKLRINQAKILLEQSSFISIANIASNCGFCDSFYFSTCFKRHIGKSPSEYRKSYFSNLW